MNIFETYWNSTKGYVNWLIEDITLQDGWYGNYFWFLGAVSLVFFLLEVVIPWRKKQAIFRRDFWLDAFYMYFNFFLFYIVLFAGLQNVAGGMMDSFWKAVGVENTVALEVGEWPVFLQFVLMFLIQDFTHWNVHRLLHKVPFLWRFHKVHHSVKEMGFAAHLRFHWMESIVYKSITYFPLLFIGFGIDDFFYLHILTITWGHFNHANIKLPLGPLRFIFNNPDMHMWHHAKELPEGRKYGVNFGLTLSLWDYLFGTNYEPHTGKDIELGFEGDEDYPQSFFQQIISGFRKS